MNSYSWEAGASCEEIIKGFSPREISIMIELQKHNRALNNKINSSQECKRRYQMALKIIDPESVPTPFKTEYNSLIN